MTTTPLSTAHTAALAAELRAVVREHETGALSSDQVASLNLAADVFDDPRSDEGSWTRDHAYEKALQDTHFDEAGFRAGWVAGRRQAVTREQHVALAHTMGEAIKSLTQAVDHAAGTNPALLTSKLAEMTESRDLIYASRQEERLKRVALARAVDRAPHGPGCASEGAPDAAAAACDCWKASVNTELVQAYEAAAEAFDQGGIARAQKDHGPLANPYRETLATLASGEPS